MALRRSDTHLTDLTRLTGLTSPAAEVEPQETIGEPLEKGKALAFFFVFMNNVITLPKSFASLDTLQRTLYRLANRCTWDLRDESESWVVAITLEQDESFEELEKDFKRTLVDYSLREKIRTETEKVRMLLFAHAFSNVAPQQ